MFQIMKKVIIFLLLLLPVAALGTQRVVPISVQQFLDEKAYTDRVRSMVPGITSFNYYVSPRIIDGQEMVDAFIAIDCDRTMRDLQREGVIINCLFDGFVTAQVPVSRLVDVSLLPGVTDLEVSRRVQLCTDSTLSVTHAGQVIDGRDDKLGQWHLYGHVDHQCAHLFCVC